MSENKGCTFAKATAGKPAFLKAVRRNLGEGGPAPQAQAPSGFRDGGLVAIGAAVAATG
jgi:hypothetical protein